MSPERDAAMWDAIKQLADEGSLSTSELLDRCVVWARHARATRRVYLGLALDEAEELGLVASRYELRGGYRHRVFEITELGRAEVRELLEEEARRA